MAAAAEAARIPKKTSFSEGVEVAVNKVLSFIQGVCTRGTLRSDLQLAISPLRQVVRDSLERSDHGVSHIHLAPEGPEPDICTTRSILCAQLLANLAPKLRVVKLHEHEDMEEVHTTKRPSGTRRRS